MMKPHDALHIESALQLSLNLHLRKRLVAIRGEQALCCGKQRSLSVGFNRSALEHEVVVVNDLTLESPLVEQSARQQVIVVGTELIPPAVETEVEQEPFATLRVDKGNRTVVSSPCVIVRDRIDIHLAFIDMTEQRPHLVGMLSGYDYVLKTCNRLHHLHASGLDIAEIWSPVGSFVRPSEHHRPLMFPFGRHTKGCCPV